MPETNLQSGREQAHHLLDALPDEKVAAVCNLLEVMVDPVSRAIANAPYDDEPETEAERQAVAASKAWLAEHSGEGITHEEILAELGHSPEDLR